jgi:hypothetical protein
MKGGGTNMGITVKIDYEGIEPDNHVLKGHRALNKG